MPHDSRSTARVRAYRGPAHTTIRAVAETMRRNWGGSRRDTGRGAKKRKTPARLRRTGALAKGWNYRWNISNISFDGNNQVCTSWEKRSSNGCQKTTEEEAGSAYGIRTRGLRLERAVSLAARRMRHTGANKLAGDRGFEPLLTDPESVVLPLDESPTW